MIPPTKRSRGELYSASEEISSSGENPSVSKTRAVAKRQLPQSQFDQAVQNALENHFAAKKVTELCPEARRTGLVVWILYTLSVSMERPEEELQFLSHLRFWGTFYQPQLTDFSEMGLRLLWAMLYDDPDFCWNLDCLSDAIPPTGDSPFPMEIYQFIAKGLQSQAKLGGGAQRFLEQMVVSPHHANIGFFISRFLEALEQGKLKDYSGMEGVIRWLKNKQSHFEKEEEYFAWLKKIVSHLNAEAVGTYLLENRPKWDEHSEREGKLLSALVELLKEAHQVELVELIDHLTLTYKGGGDVVVLKASQTCNLWNLFSALPAIRVYFMRSGFEEAEFNHIIDRIFGFSDFKEHLECVEIVSNSFFPLVRYIRKSLLSPEEMTIILTWFKEIPPDAESRERFISALVLFVDFPLLWREILLHTDCSKMTNLLLLVTVTWPDLLLDDPALPRVKLAAGDDFRKQVFNAYLDYRDEASLNLSSGEWRSLANLMAESLTQTEEEPDESQIWLSESVYAFLCLKFLWKFHSPEDMKDRGFVNSLIKVIYKCLQSPPDDHISLDLVLFLGTIAKKKPRFFMGFQYDFFLTFQNALKCARTCDQKAALINAFGHLLVARKDICHPISEAGVWLQPLFAAPYTTVPQVALVIEARQLIEEVTSYHFSLSTPVLRLLRKRELGLSPFDKKRGNRFI